MTSVNCQVRLAGKHSIMKHNAVILVLFFRSAQFLSTLFEQVYPRLESQTTAGVIRALLVYLTNRKLILISFNILRINLWRYNPNCP